MTPDENAPQDNTTPNQNPESKETPPSSDSALPEVQPPVEMPEETISLSFQEIVREKTCALFVESPERVTLIREVTKQGNEIGENAKVAYAKKLTPQQLALIFANLIAKKKGPGRPRNS